MARNPLLSPNQQTFLSAAAARTKLDPNVLGAWLRNEEPMTDQNTDPAGHGRYNFLNVGITDSKPYGAASSFWTDPRTAGDATGKWLLGQLAIPGFGKSAASIQALGRVAGKSPQEQIRAIQQSGWASGGETAMPGLYQQITGAGGVAPTTPAAAAPRVAPRVAAAPPTLAPPARPAFDPSILQAGLERSQTATQSALSGLSAISGTVAPTLPTLDLSSLMTAATPATPLTPHLPTDHVVPLRKGAPTPKGLSTQGQKAVALARKFIGIPYLWGGANPKTGFDCSGLLAYVWGKNGVQIPHNAQAQYDAATKVSAKNLTPGDAVFFRNASGIHHVGMYVGGKDREFIQAPHTGDHVKISSLNEPYYASQFAGGGKFT